MPETLDRRRFGRQLAVIASALTLAGSAQAQWTLIDNFNSGNDDAWTHQDLLDGTPWGPTIYDCAELDYQIASSEPISPGPDYVFTGAYLSDSVGNLLYTNGFLRAKIRSENESTHIPLMMRWDAELLTGYAFGVNQSNDSLCILRMNGNVVLPQACGNFEYLPGVDYILEASVNGSVLTAKIWRAGDRAPMAPQLTVTDTAFDEGAIGLYVTYIPGAASGFLSGRFDDVYFAVRPTDVDGDGGVGTSDLLLLLGAWGPCDGCPEDIDGDGEVGVQDLLALLGDWD